MRAINSSTIYYLELQIVFKVKDKGVIGEIDSIYIFKYTVAFS